MRSMGSTAPGLLSRDSASKSGGNAAKSAPKKRRNLGSEWEWGRLRPSIARNLGPTDCVGRDLALHDSPGESQTEFRRNKPNLTKLRSYWYSELCSAWAGQRPAARAESLYALPTIVIASSSTSSATSASSFVTISGGAIRMVLGPHPEQDSALEGQHRDAVAFGGGISLVFLSFTNSTPSIRPRPRTSPTSLCFFRATLPCAAACDRRLPSRWAAGAPVR